MLRLWTSSTCFVQSNVQGQDIVVRIVTTLLAERSWVRIPAGSREYFLFAKTSSPALGPTQPSVHCLPRFFPGGRAAGTLCWPLQSSVEGKNKRIYTSAPPICHDGLDRDNWVKCSSSTFWVLPEKQPLLIHSARQIDRCLDNQRSHSGRYEGSLLECDTAFNSFVEKQLASILR